MPIVKILIESGALNAADLLIYSVALLSGTEAMELMAQVMRYLELCDPKWRIYTEFHG